MGQYWPLESIESISAISLHPIYSPLGDNAYKRGPSGGPYRANRGHRDEMRSPKGSIGHENEVYGALGNHEVLNSYLIL